MPKSAPAADTSRQPGGVARRLRELREGLRPRLTGSDLANRLGEDQQWVSRRETGASRLLVDDVPRWAEQLGYRAEVVFAPLESEPARLVSAASTASPEAVRAAIDLLTTIDTMHPRLRKTVLDILADESAVTATKLRTS